MIEQENIVGKVITIPIEQMALPDEINEIVDADILKSLLRDSSFQASIDSISRCNIQVVRKPKVKKNRYLVIGGIVPYLLCLSCLGRDSLDVILLDDLKINISKSVNDDLSLWLSSFKSGAYANAAKATLLISLVKNSEEMKLPSVVGVPSSILRNKAVLKQVTGFDKRGFMRERIYTTSPSLEKICIALNVAHKAVVSSDGGMEKEA